MLRCREMTRCANSRPEQVQQIIRKLLDHLVGAGEQRGWDFEAERLGGHEIDDELELGQLNDWQIGGFCSLENLTGIYASLSKHLQKNRSIAHQSTGFDSITAGIGRRDRMARRKNRKLNTPAVKEAIGGDEQGVDALVHDGCECRLDFAARAGLDDLNLQSQGTCGFG